MSQSNSIAVYLGVDVSKQSLDVCALSAEGRLLWRRRIPRTAAAVGALAARLEGPALAVLEATGGLEALPARALEEAGVGVKVENPAKVRHFALSCGWLEKSDRLDARMLAEFARERKPAARSRPDPLIESLAQLARRRQQLVRLRAVERTRLRGETLAFNRGSLGAVIATLSERIEECEQEIRRCVHSSEALTQRARLLASAPGVGELTAYQLLAWLPELGSFNRGAIAKLAGLAPLVKQSGRWRGRAMTLGGRSHVRSALYLASLSAARWNPYFRDFYQWLLGRGKAKKVALIAVAHKLLSLLNQMVHQLRTFDPALLVDGCREGGFTPEPSVAHPRRDGGPAGQPLPAGESRALCS